MREQVTVDVTDQPDGDTDGGEIVVDGPDTIALLKREIDTAQDQNRRALIKLKPHELARFETWLRTRTHTEPPVQPTPARPTNGHAPREARNDRPRGSKRRGERSKSSSSDDPDPEPEPAERRLCGNKRCQADISHLRPDARYCDNDGACKQAAYRDRLTVAELDRVQGTVTTKISCRCDPTPELVDEGVCLLCGRQRGPVTLEWERDPAPPARAFATTRAPKQRNPRLGDGKRRRSRLTRIAASNGRELGA
jgi:hypothetical protein